MPGRMTLLALLIVAGSASDARTPGGEPGQRGTTQAPADVTCPAELGRGVTTGLLFCDVRTGLDPATGILVRVPRHRGTAVLTFDLHNRHTYSAQAVEAGTAFARYTATIGVLTLDNTLIERATVTGEFRTEADLLDRIDGGAGQDGLKAIAPTGGETIFVDIPADVTEVSILGEQLEIVRRDGRERYTAPGRQVAVVSNIMVEYRPR
jgi:hypothetical protein